jgi:hypothetical protein
VQVEQIDLATGQITTVHNQTVQMKAGAGVIQRFQCAPPPHNGTTHIIRSVVSGTSHSENVMLFVRHSMYHGFCHPP